MTNMSVPGMTLKSNHLDSESDNTHTSDMTAVIDAL